MTQTLKLPPPLEKLISLLRPFWFRGKGRLLNALVKPQGEIIATVFESRMTLDLSDQIQRNVFLGTFEPTETKQVIQYLKPGMTFVDVGANIGYFTALAASKVGPHGNVFSIEPSPYAFDRLKRLVDENNLKQVRLAQVGVSSRSGPETLYVPTQESGNHSPTLLQHSEGSPITIEIKTLDELVAEWNLEQIDLLKIDIEGLEMKAFKGATQTLAKGKIRAILCEFNDFWLTSASSSPDELFQFLLDAGFECVSKTQSLSKTPLVTHFFIQKRMRSL